MVGGRKEYLCHSLKVFKAREAEMKISTILCKQEHWNSVFIMATVVMYISNNLEYIMYFELFLFYEIKWF